MVRQVRAFVGASLAVACVQIGLVSLAEVPTAPASAGAPLANVIAGAQNLGIAVAYPAIAASGDGVYHGVIRDSSIGGTRIVYLRSTDGGRSWTRNAILSGAIGATQPAIAADGSHLVVGFISDWVDASGVHNQAPYLTTSADDGASWTPARRLGTWAFDVRVAADGPRAWAIWSGSGGIRGTTDGGATFFVEGDLTGAARVAIAAGDGVVSAAYWDASGSLGNSYVAVGQGTTLNAFHKADNTKLQDVAAADGRAYVLVNDLDGLSVLGSSPGQAPARVHVPIAGGGGDLAAGPGALAVTTCVAGTVFVSESTGWPVFGDPVAVTSFASAADCTASITAAAPTHRLTPRFDWTVAAHYVDVDGDGLPDPANITGTAADNVIVGGNDTLQVTLDGCASLSAGGGSLITRYLWSVNDALVADVDRCAGPTIEVHTGTEPKIRLEVRDDRGDRAVTVRTIAPKDLLVVSLGDSVASGEGSPIRPGNAVPSLAWSDPSCHRSSYAGPAAAAQELENSDPHTAVTFVQLACSGAAIVDTFDDPAHRTAPGDPDDPVTGGITDAYAGVAHDPRCATGGACPSLRPAQVTQLVQVLGKRIPDAVLVSTGANDVRFSSTLKRCLTPVVSGVIGSDCNVSSVATVHDTRMADLQRRYQLLADAFTAAGITADKVHVTEYFDPTGDSHGLANLRCIAGIDPDITGALFGVGGLITDDEAIWARDHVVTGLNAAMRQAAGTQHWDYVGGIAEQFAAHGYCASEPWVVRLGESFAAQGDEFGAFHPNRAGQEVYGAAIYDHLAALARTPLTAISEAAPTGAAAVGDLVILASDVWAPDPELRSIALTTTGGTPTVGAVRRLQTGPGFGGVALDGSTAAAIWVGATGTTTSDTQGYAAQLASRPNSAMRNVQLVQAAAGPARLVAERKTSVLADIWSADSAPVTTAVTTVVVSRDNGTDTEVLPATTENVTLQPGSNRVLLPTASTFAAPDGSILVATVTVADPPGATEDDLGDNEMSTDPSGSVETMRTRPLRIALLPLDVGGATVGCSQIQARANTWVAWSQQVLPVPDGGVLAELSCLPEVLMTGPGESGVAQVLADLDLLAREAGLDAVVAVAPDGWLGAQLGDASVGRAGVTGRSVLLELGSPPATLAHELGHNLGLDHAPPQSAVGAWISRHQVIDGSEFMAASWDGVSTEWVTPDTWDLLTGSLNEGSAPTQPAVGGSAYWVRGSMPVEGDSIRLDPFLDDGDAPSSPPAAADTSRLTVVPVAADGSPTGPPVAIGLTGVEGAGSTVITAQFAQKVVAPPGTAGFRFLLDGRQVAERLLGSPPTISLTAPAAGAVVARSSTVHVAWSVTDPDTDAATPAPTVDLLVSDDDGVTWRPFASHLIGLEADLAVPRDLGGDTIRLRAVASDGVYVRWSDSERFAIVGTAGEDRLVFVADASDPAATAQTPSRIGTMRSDGSDVQMLALPTVRDQEQHRPVAYSSPVWGPGGDRIFYVSAERSAGVSCAVVNSVAADGSGLRRELGPGSADCAAQPPTDGHCLSLSADGSRLLLDNTVYQSGSGGWTSVGRLFWSEWWNPTTPEWWGLLPYAPNIAVTVRTDQCPTLSPDGTLIAGVLDVHGQRTDVPSVGAELAVAVSPVIPQSGESSVSMPRLVSAWDETMWRADDAVGSDPRQLAVRWSGSDQMLVTRGTPGWHAADVERLDLSTMTAPDFAPMTPAAATVVGTIAVPSSGAMHRAPKDSPGEGPIYGDIDCGWYVGTTTYQSSAVLGGQACLSSVDWGRPIGNVVPQARVAFVAGDRDVEHPAAPPDLGSFPSWDRVGTMQPDGSDARFFDVPTMIEEPPTVVTPQAWRRPANYSSPVWGPDGRIYFMEKGGELSSVRADGSDRRVEFSNGGGSAIGFDRDTMRPCLSMSPGGPYEDLLWLENFTVYGAAYPGQPHGDINALKGTNNIPLSAYHGLFTFPEPSPADIQGSGMWGVGCPMLSPDGRYAARVEAIAGGYGVAVTPVAWRGDWSWLAARFGASPWMTGWRFVTLIDSVPMNGVSWLNAHELLVTKGGAQQLRVDLSTLTLPSQPYNGEPLTPAATTEMSTMAIPDSTSAHRAAKPLPGGIYGDIDCGLYYGTTSLTTYASPYVPGTSTCSTDFAWNGVGLDPPSPGGTGSDLSVLVIDPDLATVPVEPAPRGDPEVIGVGPPAPGSGEIGARPQVGRIQPAVVTLKPGEGRDIVLSNDTGAVARYEVDPTVDQPTGGGHVSVTGAVDPATGLVVTDSSIRLIADVQAATSTSPARVRVHAFGSTSFETIEVQISAPPRPLTADDSLDVQVGVESIFSATALLGNDRSSDPTRTVELVRAWGFSGGTAFIDAEGKIHVTAGSVGVGTFWYQAIETGSLAYSTAAVTVHATQVPAATPVPTASPTNAPSSDTAATTPDTTAATSPPPTTAAGPAPPSAVPSWFPALPRTGAQPTRAVAVALLCLLIGVLLVVGSRRRWSG